MKFDGYIYICLEKALCEVSISQLSMGNLDFYRNLNSKSASLDWILETVWRKILIYQPSDWPSQPAVRNINMIGLFLIQETVWPREW